MIAQTDRQASKQTIQKQYLFCKRMKQKHPINTGCNHWPLYWHFESESLKSVKTAHMKSFARQFSDNVVLILVLKENSIRVAAG